MRLNRGLSKLLVLPDRTGIVAIASDDPIRGPALVAEQLRQVAAGMEEPALIVGR